jgi:4-amino-4-deoxy-L-arabinose transferase-like glycosyltransferase
MTSTFAWTELTTGIFLVAIYLSALVGVFCELRRRDWPLAQSIATAVPLCQAALSLIFQMRFLFGSALVGVILSVSFLAYCWRAAFTERAQLRHDSKHIAQFAKNYAWCTIPILISLIYTFAQVLLLPIKNHDALTYHLPRVFLFIQENSFFLEAFNRYHEVIFPVGADVLFYPFIAMGTMHGLAIFSFSSYIAIGAASYALSRRFASERNSVVSAIILISLTVISLQAATVKNDIIMASCAAAALLLVLQSPRPASHRVLLLLAGLCAFGISIKTTFIAFIPGLGLLAIIHFRLWRKKQIVATALALFKDYKLSLACLLAIIVASQIWLFAWNAQNYETWSGPDEFTARHKQHDGFKGTLANSVRYGFQTLQVGSITDTLGAAALAQEQFSEQLNALYQKTAEPYFGNAGASREAFEVAWVTHEDWAWFGPLGAFIFFICIPWAIARKPSTLVILLPALGYFLIVAAKVSWMPWNGRFFSTFFIAACPALAITLESWNDRTLRKLLCLIAISALLIAKAIDFSRPLLPIGRQLYLAEESNPMKVIKKSLETEQNAWEKALSGSELHKGEPSTLLQNVPSGSSAALYLNGHNQHFGFFMKRPDLTWYPLNYIRGVETIDFQKAVDTFMRSEIEYLLLIGIYAEALDSYLVAKSTDNTTHLIFNPRMRDKHPEK